MPDPRTVFVIHGRNENARQAIFDFLRAIGLLPMEWAQMVGLTGSAMPYVGDVIARGFEVAQAVVGLFTGDDEANLRSHLISTNDLAEQPTPQPRQNVILEAGMALSVHPKRTVLVEIGQLRPISDLAGLHTIRLNNSVARRQELVQRLRDAGCQVISDGADWHRTGNFENVEPKHRPRVQYDETAELRHILAAKSVGRNSLLEWLTLACAKSTRTPSDPSSLMEALRAAGIGKGLGTAYWQLVVEGVLKFTNPDRWWDGKEPTWKTSIPYVTLARRGAALLESLRSEDGS